MTGRSLGTIRDHRWKHRQEWRSYLRILCHRRHHHHCHHSHSPIRTHCPVVVGRGVGFPSCSGSDAQIPPGSGDPRQIFVYLLYIEREKKYVCHVKFSTMFGHVSRPTLFFCNGPSRTRAHTHTAHTHGRIHKAGSRAQLFRYQSIVERRRLNDTGKVNICLIGRSFVTRLPSFLDVYIYIYIKRMFVCCVYMCVQYTVCKHSCMMEETLKNKRQEGIRGRFDDTNRTIFCIVLLFVSIRTDQREANETPSMLIKNVSNERSNRDTGCRSILANLTIRFTRERETKGESLKVNNVRRNRPIVHCR